MKVENRRKSVGGLLWLIDPCSGIVNSVLENASILTNDERTPFATVGDSIFYVACVPGLKTMLMRFYPVTKSFLEIKSFRLNGNPPVHYREFSIKENVYFGLVNFDRKASELWKYNETEGIRLLRRFDGQDNQYAVLSDFTDFAGKLYFLESGKLYVSQGDTVTLVDDVKHLTFTSLKRCSDKLFLATEAGEAGQSLYLYGPRL